MPKQALGYTVVQHSAYGYKKDGRFSRGLEPTMLHDAEDKKLVERVGGLVFPTYGEADDFCMKAMYPVGAQGLIPQAKGTFSESKVNGLAVYVPVRQVVG